MSGALAIIVTVSVEAEAAFESWHTTEHLAERLDLAGMHRARRFVSVPGTPKAWFVLYDVEDVGVLASEAYRARLDAPADDKSARTREVANAITSTSRTAATVRYEWCAARASGGFIAVWRFDASPECRPGLLGWLYEAGPAAAATVEGAVRFAVLDGDRAVSAIPSAEKNARAGGVDHEFSELVLLVEGHSLSAVAEVCQRLQPLQSEGAAAGDLLGFFTLQIDASAPER